MLGEEAAAPRRVIPRAILGTVLLATVYFVFVTWAQAIGYGVAGAGRWAADPTALATLSDRYIGHWFAVLVDVVVVIDAFVAALAGVHLTARTLFAMGRDRALPGVFAATTTRLRSPYAGIGVSVALTLVLGATLGRHYGVITYFALMATTASLGILLVYALVAIAGMVFFWKVRHKVGERYNVLLDVVLPLIAVAICGYTIYASVFPRPPAPISYSLWIALAWLAAGMAILAGLVLARPDRVRSFGKAFGAGARQLPRRRLASRKGPSCAWPAPGSMKAALARLAKSPGAAWRKPATGDDHLERCLDLGDRRVKHLGDQVNLGAGDDVRRAELDMITAAAMIRARYPRQDEDAPL